MKKNFNLIFFLLCIGLAGLAFRFAFVWEVAFHPTLNVTLEHSDLYSYDLMARDLLQDQPIGLRMIGYPLFIHYLKMFYRFIGTSPFAFYFHYFILSILSAFLLYRIGAMYWGKLAGVLAALMLIFYKMNYLYDVLKIHTALSQFLIIAVLYFFCVSKEKKSFPSYTGLLIFGILLCLLRTFFWFLFLPSVLYLFIAHRQWKNKKYIFLNTLCFCIALWGFYRLHGTDPHMHKFGVHFYIGNHADATGLFMPPEGVSKHAESLAKDTALIAFKETGSSQGISRYWIKKTFDSYHSSPLSVFKVLARKAVLFINNYEPHNNASIYFYEQKTKLKHYPRLDYAFIFAFFILGFIFLLKSREKGRFLILPVIVLCGMILSVFFCSRYRMPVIPFFCLLAGFGMSRYIETVKTKKMLQVIFCTTLLSLLLLASYQDISLLNKEKDIQFWEKREVRKERINKKRQNALQDYGSFGKLNDFEKIKLAKKLGSLGLVIEFFHISDKSIQLAKKSTDENSLLILLRKKAEFYEEAFLFSKALGIWNDVWAFDSMREFALKRIEEIYILGPLFDKEFPREIIEMGKSINRPYPIDHS